MRKYSNFEWMTFENGKQGVQLDWAFNCSSNDDKERVCKQSRPENIWRCGNVYSIPPNEREASAGLQRVSGKHLNVNKRNLGQNSSENISISASANSNLPPKKKERRAILRPTKCCRFFNKMQKRRAQLCCRQGRQFQIDISVMPSNLTCTLTPIQSGDESAAPNIRRVNKFQRLIAWPITTTASPLFQYFKNFISTQSFPLINDFNSIFFAIFFLKNYCDVAI